MTPSKWKCGRMIGSGGFGKVYKCFDANSNSVFAVKYVKFEVQSHLVQAEFQALRNEIKILEGVKHERIVQCYGCRATADALAIFLVYIPGGSLFDHIREFGACSEHITQHYTLQILQGLTYLHGKKNCTQRYQRNWTDMAGNISSSYSKSCNLPPEKKLRLQKADGVSVSGSILETEDPVNHNSNKRTFDQVSPKRHTETKDSFVQVAMDPYVRVREIEGIHYCYKNAIGKLDSLEQSSISPKDSGVVQRNIQTSVGNEKSQNSETMRFSEIRGQFNDVDKAVDALLKQEDHAIENEPHWKTSNANNSEASPGSSNESVLVGIFMLSEVKGLVEENTSLRDERLCKVCMERDASLTFIPCGHLVTCYKCFLSLDNCPICKRNIGSAIRTYMS